MTSKRSFFNAAAYIIKSALVFGLLFLALSCNSGDPAGNNGNNSAGTLTDADGNVYHTITLGTQVWTVENLRTTKFNDGSSISQVADSILWKGLATQEKPGCCWYGNDAGANSAYGVLYNWYAVMSGKLAPAGWHIPTDAEWTALRNYLVSSGHNWDGSTSGNKIAKAMAAKTSWSGSDTAGDIGNDLTKNNKSGFSALPAGLRNTSCTFVDRGNFGAFWSAPATGANWTVGRLLRSDSDSLALFYPSQTGGYSTRLVKD